MPPATTNPAPDTLEGTVAEIRFHAPDTGWQVFVLADGTTVVGSAAGIHPGHEIRAQGRWNLHPRYGRRFEADSIQLQIPATAQGIRSYLASGMVEGIGPVYAERLVEHFGTNTFDVIDLEPARLSEVDGIGPKRAAAIRAGWEEHREIRDIMAFLLEHGAGNALAVRIYRELGPGSVGQLLEDPYRLARIHGIGFRSADSIALNLDRQTNDPHRLAAGVDYALRDARNSAGHCGLPREELVRTMMSLLSRPGEPVDRTLALQAIATAETTKRLIAASMRQTEVLFPAWLHRLETEAAAMLTDLAHRPPPWKSTIDPERAISWAERKLGWTLLEGQRHGLATLLVGALGTISGWPGTGKTATLRCLVAILTEHGLRVSLAAPTGAAAKRMTQATSHPAATQHRLLEATPRKFGRNRNNPLTTDVLILDETSMVDVPLLHATLSALPDHAALILVGDPDQLPSVGPGNVFADILNAGIAPGARLTEIVRQAEGSWIVRNAHRINRGAMPDLSNPSGTDFFWIEAANSQDTRRKLLQVVERMPAAFALDPVRDVQTLAPMRKGHCGATLMNDTLQTMLNPHPVSHLQHHDRRFGAGDKTLQLRNNYDLGVMNGEGGFITATSDNPATLEIDYDGRTVSHPRTTFDDLDLAYASTIHKAQGSEYPCAILPVVNEHAFMLEQSLLYTAVTRGKRIVVTVGQKNAWRTGLRKRTSRARWSLLGTLLSEHDNPLP